MIHIEHEIPSLDNSMPATPPFPPYNVVEMGNRFHFRRRVGAYIYYMCKRERLISTHFHEVKWRKLGNGKAFTYLRALSSGARGPDFYTLVTFLNGKVQAGGMHLFQG